MKKHLPWMITAAAAALILIALVRPASPEQQKWDEFKSLPVLLNGRIKPMDTVARNTLLVLHNKQTLRLPEDSEPEKLKAIEWLAEVCFDPRTADNRPLFPIHDPQVLSLFGWQQTDEKYFSFTQIRPHFDEIDRQARLADPVEAKDRSQFQRHILELYSRLVLYQQLKNSLQDERSENFDQLVAQYEQVLVPGAEAIRAHGNDLPSDDPTLNTLLSLGVGFQQLAERAYFFVVPPRDPAAAELRTDWKNVGQSLMMSLRDGSVHPVVKGYARLGAAYRANDDAAFVAATTEIHDWLERDYQPELTKTDHETFFNRFGPFYLSMGLYVLVMLLACFSWLTGPGILRRTALHLAILALVIHTAGIAYRVILQGYAPVTNLYSSAVFVGWAAVLMGVILEGIFRNAVGTAQAGLVGFVTLIIAHHLSLSGDTMEMMQAVLDNNFWLSTHVLTITIGYSAVFLAGALGLAYILRGVFSTGLREKFGHDKLSAETNGRALYRMTYGIICFATLFSFVGTVLGGIWADQSWGRFWGWDPKENGAALIVLWCAIMLHARWGGYVRERGFMVMSVFGNIVTAWSWFGVNLLSVGLHSYGFTESGAYWLGLFWLSQLAVIGIGLTPLHRWRSFAGTAPAHPPPVPAPGSHPHPAGGAAGN